MKKRISDAIRAEYPNASLSWTGDHDLWTLIVQTERRATEHVFGLDFNITNVEADAVVEYILEAIG